jgi:hypothetical protein
VLPQDLVGTINDMVRNRKVKLEQLLSYSKDEGVTLYGEGYGPGIQKHGGQYREDKGFVLFDIARYYDHREEGGDLTQYYLQPNDVRDVAENCGLTTAPRILEGAGLEAMTKRVRDGIPSTLAKFKGGERQAEGIIAQAPGLWHWFDGSLKRLKFKLKTKDFPG